MHFVVTLIIAGFGMEVSVASDRSESIPRTSISYDFDDVYPHKIWVSSWNRDDQYPDGFRYKILSARHETAKRVELVVILEEPGGTKTEMKRMESGLSDFDRVAQVFLDGLADSYDLDFDFFDFSRCRTAQQFEEEVSAIGWKEWRP